jgi:hypothetical protein
LAARGVPSLSPQVARPRGLDRRVQVWTQLREAGPALEEAGLEGRGITVHGLRSAAVSIYAASGLTLAETAVMGQADPLVTWRHYLKVFDRSKVNERIRAAQESIELVRKES